MISLISIEEFVDKIYPPVHDRRTMYACKLVKALRSVGKSVNFSSYYAMRRFVINEIIRFSFSPLSQGIKRV